jgi:hypothetical protein
MDLLHGDVEAALAVSIGLDQLKAINAYSEMTCLLRR